MNESERFEIADTSAQVSRYLSAATPRSRLRAGCDAVLTIRAGRRVPR
jgi:hypothetical protein